jgi:hypothetical protein
MVTAYVPGDVEANVQDAVDVPPAGRVTLAEHDTVRADDADELRVTGPDNPERLVKLRVLLPDVPAVKETDEAEIT